MNDELLMNGTEDYILETNNTKSNIIRSTVLTTNRATQ